MLSLLPLNVIDLLTDLGTGQVIAPDQREFLADRLLTASPIFGITPDHLTQVLEQRLVLFPQIYPRLADFCQQKSLPDWPITLWDLWLPLAIDLAHQKQQIDRPLIQAMLGGQGAGKTTLSWILSQILSVLGYCTLSWSIDDLYKTYADRLQLQQTDPRLIWRGPPGTHDVELGLTVLEQLRQGQSPIAIPRFDKSLHHGAGDRTVPDVVEQVDIVLFDGWFVGVQPVDPQCCQTAPEPIITEADRAFARDCNQRLRDYLPLWHQCDRLWVLYLPDYRCSRQWRRQAEQEMRSSGKPGMTDDEIDAFVNYFWRALHPNLFIAPLTQTADLVIEIQANHALGQVYGATDLHPTCTARNEMAYTD